MSAHEPMLPWMSGPLSEWSIVGMNHYHISGERCLYVSMVKGRRCITEEGKDDKYLWNRLCHRAWREEALIKESDPALGQFAVAQQPVTNRNQPGETS